MSFSLLDCYETFLVFWNFQTLIILCRCEPGNRSRTFWKFQKKILVSFDSSWKEFSNTFCLWFFCQCLIKLFWVRLLNDEPVIFVLFNHLLLAWHQKIFLMASSFLYSLNALKTASAKMTCVSRKSFHYLKVTLVFFILSFTSEPRKTSLEVLKDLKGDV